MTFVLKGGAFSLEDFCFRFEDLFCFIELGFCGGISKEVSLNIGLLGGFFIFTNPNPVCREKDYPTE